MAKSKPAPAQAKADPGVYIEDGEYGTGWYHYSTEADQKFISHKGEADFFIFDFHMDEQYRPSSQGRDTIVRPGPEDQIIMVNDHSPYNLTSVTIGENYVTGPDGNPFTPHDDPNSFDWVQWEPAQWTLHSPVGDNSGVDIVKGTGFWADF